MNAEAKLKLYDQICDILLQLEAGTNGCLQARTGMTKINMDLEATIGPGPLTLPWVFMNIRQGLSNHAALIFDQHVAQVAEALEELNTLVNIHMGALRGIYIPQIKMIWGNQDNKCEYLLQIDNIRLTKSSVGLDEFCGKVSAALLRHKNLPIEGPVELYEVENAPVYGRDSVEIMATSEVIAVARIGALLGMSAKQMWLARDKDIRAFRVSATTALETETARLLAKVGLD